MPRTDMLINRKTIHIEWGDCDALGIVYYPRYMAYFDNCTAALFLRAGLPKQEMLGKYGIAGIPMVDLKANFKIPSRFGDDVVVESCIPEWRRSSFRVHHRLLAGGNLAVECFELRVWVGKSADDPEKLQSRPVPQEVIDRFTTASDLNAATQNPAEK
jgi:4-hydroxybenzoyl-CoA thioesterase